MEKMAPKNIAKRTTKPSPPKKEKRGPSHGEKGPNSSGERPPEIEIVFLCWRDVRLLSPPPCGCIWANVIIKCTIFSEITHPMIVSKYTLECIRLNYFLKIFSTDYTLESSSNKIEPHYTHRTIDNASEMYVLQYFPIISKIISPMFEHGFLVFFTLDK